jgi:hypothetical protein
MRTFVAPISFGDGKYQLGPLSLKQVVELERLCGAKDAQGAIVPKSVYQIHSECEAGLGFEEQTEKAGYFGGGAARPMDIYHTVRLLLIAGNSGMVAGSPIEVGPTKAAQLCDDYLYPHRPMIEGQYLAWAGLNAMIVGVDVKKKAEPSQERDLSPSAEE